MSMHVTFLAKSSYHIMPWKNGAGSTTELMIRPVDASVQSGFHWRISQAQVLASGPFSSFPNFTRTIVLLQGDPMRLVHEENGEHLLQGFKPYTFRGEWKTLGVLTGKPVEDFNVMVRDDFGHAYVDIYEGQANLSFSLRKAALQFVWVSRGSAVIELDGLEHTMQEHESLLVENGPGLALRLLSQFTQVIAVNIEMLSKAPILNQ